MTSFLCGDPRTDGTNCDVTMDLSSSSHHTDDDKMTTTAMTIQSERAAVRDFMGQCLARWEMQHHPDTETLTLATFPFTFAERQSLQRARLQGAWEGTLAGIATLLALRGAPWVMMRLMRSWNLRRNGKFYSSASSSSSPSRGFRSPFTSLSARSTTINSGLSTTKTRNRQQSRNTWMDAGFLIVDASLSFAVAMAVATHYAPAGDPTLEAIVRMPALDQVMPSSPPSRNSSSSSGQPPPYSVVIHQICPLTVDVYREMTMDDGSTITAGKMQPSIVLARQQVLFVKSCFTLFFFFFFSFFLTIVQPLYYTIVAGTKRHESNRAEIQARKKRVLEANGNKIYAMSRSTTFETPRTVPTEEEDVHVLMERNKEAERLDDDSAAADAATPTKESIRQHIFRYHDAMANTRLTTLEERLQRHVHTGKTVLPPWGPFYNGSTVLYKNEEATVVGHTALKVKIALRGKTSIVSGKSLTRT
eukprot:scaffold1340_cov233-Amphora_coffeaeformis.AAC.5